MRVAPFGHLRISGYVLLPAAFRSLSRLSSALSAKASTLRSYWLDLLDGMYSVTYLHGFGSLSLPSRGPFHLSFTVLCSIGH